MRARNKVIQLSWSVLKNPRWHKNKRIMFRAGHMASESLVDSKLKLRGKNLNIFCIMSGMRTAQWYYAT